MGGVFGAANHATHVSQGLLSKKIKPNDNRSQNRAGDLSASDHCPLRFIGTSKPVNVIVTTRAIRLTVYTDSGL